jgi:hypothetical protein
MSTTYFQSYRQLLTRVLMAEMVEQTIVDATPRRLSISAPCIHGRAWRAPSDRSFSVFATTMPDCAQA